MGAPLAGLVNYVSGVPLAADFAYRGGTPICVDATNGDIYVMLTGVSPYNVIRKVVGTSAPVTVTGTTYAVTVTDASIIANRAGTVTLTLPAAASFSGRSITVRTIQAQTVVSDASNVVPLAGGAAGTAILAATAGKWARLQSDGASWQIMEAA
jgi:hypothetical protein